MPTILDVCGINQPKGIITDGLSLVPFLQDSSVVWRKSLYREVTYTRGVVTKDYNYIAVRFPGDIQKLVSGINRKEFTQEGVRLNKKEQNQHQLSKIYPGYFEDDQLYDLKYDSLEQNNLAGNSEYNQVLVEMQEELTMYCENLPFPFGEFKTRKRKN